VVIDAFGVSDGYHDIAGTWHPTSDATRAALHAAMGTADHRTGPWFVVAGTSEPLWSACTIALEDGTEVGPLDRLPDDLPVGYHELRPLDGSRPSTVIIHPAQCPAAPRAWGVAAQVYALWSSASWGIGDLADVAALGRAAADHGAGLMLLSPLHAPAPTAEQENSPYSPSSRCWWNPLLLPIATPPPAELAVDPERLIDRDAVWAAKRAALWEEYRAAGDDRPWGVAPVLAHGAPPTSWAAATTRGIGDFSAWSALAERHGADWRAWPEPLRRPGPAVGDHVAADPELVAAADFHRWLQWRLHDQLAALGPGRGPIGLIGDMAVGITPEGFDAWRFQDLLAGGGIMIGAPPDALAPDGQNWRLPPFVPWKLRAAGYRPLIDTLRAVFTGMAGIRIDHVMGLFRQYWVLPGGGGAYIYFPAVELLAIVAVEAHRAGAFVVGEDLGTVPVDVPPAMRARGMLGTKVALLDEHPPADWPEACVGTLTTHDLPTMAGVLSGDGSNEMRDRLALAMGERGGAAAIDILAKAAESVGGTIDAAELRSRLIGALHDAVLDSPARIRLVTTDDLCATPQRENVPGTVGPPNWCRPLPHPVDEIPWDSVRNT
jgi:4-alpha-glucanotransferase